VPADKADPRHPRQLRRPQAPKVRAWLARHPRWTFHFTPTSCSWLNAVEGFFAKLTRRGSSTASSTPSSTSRPPSTASSRIQRRSRSPSSGKPIPAAIEASRRWRWPASSQAAPFGLPDGAWLRAASSPYCNMLHIVCMGATRVKPNLPLARSTYTGHSCSVQRCPPLMSAVSTSQPSVLHEQRG
jgi:transposase